MYGSRSSRTVVKDWYVRVDRHSKFVIGSSRSVVVEYLANNFMTTCLVFGVAYHAFLFPMHYFIFQAEETWTPLMSVMIVASTATFVAKSVYLVAATTPLTKSTELRRRVYGLLSRNDDWCCIHKKRLLNVIKSQGDNNPCSRIALTAVWRTVAWPEVILQTIHLFCSSYCLILQSFEASVSLIHEIIDGWNVTNLRKHNTKWQMNRSEEIMRNR